MNDFPNVKPSSPASAALGKPSSSSTDAEQRVLLAGGLLQAATRQMRVLAATRGRSWRTARRIATVTAAAALALSLLGAPAAGLTPKFDGPFLNPFGLASSGSTPEFVDIDGDGDFDALIGTSEGGWVFFENTGTETAPAFAAPETNPFGLASLSLCFENYDSRPESFPCPIDPAFADIDGDGDLDALVGFADGYDGTAFGFFQRNGGTATAPAFAGRVPQFLGFADDRSGWHPTFVDIDGDGDLDNFNGTDFAGHVVFFENTGTATAPAFVAAETNPFGLAGVDRYSSPAFADIDGDGDLDGLFGNSAGDVVFLENTGSVTEPAFAAPSTNPFGLANVGSSSSPAFADIDGDGDLDALIGNSAGDVVFFENVAISETRTPTDTPTPTPTATPTQTPTDTPTATPGDTPGADCVGDCDGDEQVGIDELTLGVAIALGNTDADQCRAMDRNRDERVAVDELITAVGAALNGCPLTLD